MRQPASTYGGQVAGIQVLRGLAALSVAFLHTEQAAGVFVGRPGESPWPWLRFFPWEAGVDVFFVISGFVMAYASAALFGAPGVVRRFLDRRFTRVVPLYWLVTALTVLIALAVPGLLHDPLGDGVRTVLASFLFIPWPRPDGTMEPVFRLGWTLNYEIEFYLIFALFLPLPRRRAAAGVIAAILALAAAGALIRPGNAQLAFWTDPIVAEFALGVALGALRVEGLRLSGSVRGALIATGLIGLAWAGPDALQGRAIGYGAPAGCLVAAASFGPGRPGGSWLGRAGLALGDASYALYLFHLFPMRGLRELWMRLDLAGPAASVCFIAASLAASCVVAVALHRAVERPLVRTARRLTG